MKSYARILRGIAKKIFKVHSNKDFNRLHAYDKEHYEDIAEDVISDVPIRCPVYQCGGFMEPRAKRPPYKCTHDDEYIGDEQTPDLICTNCHAVYEFLGFHVARRWGRLGI